ncbi:MAG: UDP-N-acetylmuramate dehydrogenase, partial [Patescibacteria group bacterium]
MVSLLPYNTLRVPAKAHDFKLLKSLKELKKLRLVGPHLFLGGGANILFVHDFAGTVIHINLKGKKIISERDDEITIEVAAGENWHDIVMWAVQNNWYGMENMALIPGTVGAAVVGNIAAYGQNQEDIFVKLQATSLKTQKIEEFNKADCQFGYRESIFKHQLKNYLVTSVTYQLSKTAHLNTSYRSRYESLAAELPPKSSYTPIDITEAVIRLRSKKLPDPKLIGTAGSFFKNPIISKKKYLTLAKQISGLQAYPPQKLQYTDESQWLDKVDQVKIPAGRILDELGWKAKRVGNVGTYPTHALTVVNYGGATGAEIYDFAESMRADIKNNFDIDLEYEVV